MTKGERQAKIDYLNSYKWLVLEISRQTYRLERKEDRMYGAKIPTLSDMPRGGQAVTIESLVVDKVELEHEIDENEALAVKTKAQIEQAIASLFSSRDRTILKMKFVDDCTHEQIAEWIHYSITQTKKYYERALEHFVIPTHCD